MASEDKSRASKFQRDYYRRLGKYTLTNTKEHDWCYTVLQYHLRRKTEFYRETLSKGLLEAFPSNGVSEYVIDHDPVHEKWFRIGVYLYASELGRIYRGPLPPPPPVYYIEDLTNFALSSSNLIGIDLCHKGRCAKSTLSRASSSVRIHLGCGKHIGNIKSSQEDFLYPDTDDESLGDVIRRYVQRPSLFKSRPKDLLVYPEGTADLSAAADVNWAEPDISQLQDFLCTMNNGPCEFAAIYDGHGGQEVAAFLAANTHRLLARHPMFWSMDFAVALSQVIEYLDLCTKPMTLDPDKHDEYFAGSTMVCCLLLGNKIVVANVGDSQASLSRGNQVLNLTAVHNHLNPQEAWRVELTSQQDVDRRPFFGRSGCLNNELAVSRAIGDRNIASGRKMKGLVHNPDIVELLLGTDDEFIFLACDGIFDVMTHQKCFEVIRNSIKQQSAIDGNAYMDAADDVLTKALKLMAHDNLSVIVCGIDHRGHYTWNWRQVFSGEFGTDGA